MGSGSRAAYRVAVEQQALEVLVLDRAQREADVDAIVEQGFALQL